MSKYKIPNSNIRKYSRCMRVTAMLLAAGMALSNMFPVSAKTAVKISLSRHRVRIQEGKKAIVRIKNTGKKKIRIKAANRKTVSARLAANSRRLENRRNCHDRGKKPHIRMRTADIICGYKCEKFLDVCVYCY